MPHGGERGVTVLFWTPQCHADIGAHGSASTIGALMMQVSHHILSQPVDSKFDPECYLYVIFWYGSAD